MMPLVMCLKVLKRVRKGKQEIFVDMVCSTRCKRDRREKGSEVSEKRRWDQGRSAEERSDKE